MDHWCCRMRENYRPDLASHASSPLGVPLAGGGDSVLRGSPMTFEPMINMADAGNMASQKQTVNPPVQSSFCFKRGVLVEWPDHC